MKRSILRLYVGSVNGNHDNMSRGYIKNTNEYFKEANFYLNGYKGERGCMLLVLLG